MSSKNPLASSPRLIRLVMSSLPPSVHEGRSERLAKMVLHKALRSTRAYSAFLIHNGFDPEKAAWERFGELPLTSKKSYLDQYSLADRCVDGDLRRTYVIERSSGNTGTPYYWPRIPRQDESLVSEIDVGLRMFYAVDRIPTLLVSTFALGTWVGGVKLAQLLRDVAMTGKYPITVVTPGVNVDEVLEMTRDLAPSYGQTLMFGYPPLLKTILEEGVARGMDWPAYGVQMMMGGEGFPEEQREDMTRTLGGDPERDLVRVRAGYGAADLGTGVGEEYPLTVLVRKLCTRDLALSRDLFGQESVPDLFQYDPGTALVEGVGDELVFTVDAAVPLVRYAIHDLGGVLSYEAALGILAEHGYDALALLAERGVSRGDIWRLPFMYCYGRADGAVIVGGANLYPENVIAVLAQAGDHDVLGHKLSIGKGRLTVDLEHRKRSLSRNEATTLAARYHQLLVEGLPLVNTEYADQLRANARAADPLVRVFCAGGGPFRADLGRLKRRYTVKGRIRAD